MHALRKPREKGSGGPGRCGVSHEKGTAVVHLEKNVEDSVLKQAVEAQDYKVTGIA